LAGVLRLASFPTMCLSWAAGVLSILVLSITHHFTLRAAAAESFSSCFSVPSSAFWFGHSCRCFGCCCCRCVFFRSFDSSIVQSVFFLLSHPFSYDTQEGTSTVLDPRAFHEYSERQRFRGSFSNSSRPLTLPFSRLG
jgi:hypothetical protein